MKQCCPERVIDSLAIPAINDNSLKILMSEPSLELFDSFHETEHIFSKDGPFTWSELEEGLVDANRWRERVRQSKSTLQNLRAALPDPAPRNARCIVVGEETQIQLEISNSLQVGCASRPSAISDWICPPLSSEAWVAVIRLLR